MTLRRSSEARSSGSSRTELENDAANTRIDHAAPGASAALSDNDDVSVKRPSDAGASLRCCGRLELSCRVHRFLAAKSLSVSVSDINLWNT